MTADDTDLLEALRDSAAQTLARAYPFEVRTRAWQLPGGHDPAHWALFAQLGWLGLGLPESAGGLGGVPEQAVLAEALGRALVVEPWLAACGLAGPLLGEAGGHAGHADRVAAGVQGRTLGALAAWERQGRYDAFDVQTTARRSTEGWQIDGHKCGVLGAGVADHWLVLARTGGAARERDGLSLFVVPAGTPGASLHPLRSYDARHTGELALQAVALPSAALAGPLHGAWPLVERAIDRAAVLLCAECVGAMALVLDLCRDHLSQRRQFGQSILSNQVVRHRLVDLFVALTQARAVTEAAARSFTAGDAARRRAVSIAKAFVGPAARAVGKDAVQLHGAIGMSDELAVGQACKRLSAAEQWFGDADWHGRRLDADRA